VDLSWSLTNDGRPIDRPIGHASACSFFTGNYVPKVSIQAANLSADVKIPGCVCPACAVNGCVCVGAS
jgi:allantoicase